MNDVRNMLFFLCLVVVGILIFLAAHQTVVDKRRSDHTIYCLSGYNYEKPECR